MGNIRRKLIECYKQRRKQMCLVTAGLRLCENVNKCIYLCGRSRNDTCLSQHIRYCRFFPITVITISLSLF